MAVSIEEAQANLKELIHHLSPGEELLITEDQRPIARIVAEQPIKRQARQPGRCQSMITLAIEDDEHLKDFAEFLP